MSLREAEKVKLVLEGAKESITIEYKGEKLDSGLESYLTLSFFDLDKHLGKGQFVINWVEGTTMTIFVNDVDWTPSFGKTTREVVEVAGTIEASNNGLYASHILSLFLCLLIVQIRNSIQST